MPQVSKAVIDNIISRYDLKNLELVDVSIESKYVVIDWQAPHLVHFRLLNDNPNEGRTTVYIGEARELFSKEVVAESEVKVNSGEPAQEKIEDLLFALEAKLVRKRGQ